VSPKRAKKKAVRGKSARKKAVRRVARPAKRAKPAARAPRRSAKPAKPARRKAAPKQASRKQASRGKKKAAKRPAPRPARRAELRLVRRPAPAKPTRPAKPRHKPFGAALAGASAKDLALFDLVRARVEVQASIQGMLASSAETPVAEGKWSTRQIVLHLHYWDREMLPFVEPAWRENRRPPHTKDDILGENATSQHELAAHDWDVARRLMQQSREALIEALQSVPEEPAGMWSAEHALGWLIRILAHHDRHHAAVIKDARTRIPG